MKQVFEELAQTPLGRVLKKALDAVGDVTTLAEPLYRMQEQMLPRLKSRQQYFTPTDEALDVFKKSNAQPHVISLARSHNWYAPALKAGYKPGGDYTMDDLTAEAARQLYIRQGISAAEDQSDIAGVSTMMLSRAIIETTPPGTAVLGDTVAWEGYAIPPAMEQRPYMTKPESQSWCDYIAENFKNPKDIGAIFITSPHSLTGKYTDPAVLKELMEISDEYGIKLVLNNVHATPDAAGKLPEPQTSMVANNKSPNLIVMTSTTKQVMPYAVPGLENAQLNVFYSPDAALVAQIAANAATLAKRPEQEKAIAPDYIAPAVEMFKASDRLFYTNMQRESQERRNIVADWLAQQDGIDWYKGEKPDTTYHATLTVDHKLLAKNGVKTVLELYDYILFTTGLDTAPVFDSGPGGAQNDAGDISFRANYSLPKEELKLVLGLLGTALDQMRKGVTLDDVYAQSKREGLKLVADANAPPPAGAKASPPKPAA